MLLRDYVVVISLLRVYVVALLCRCVISLLHDYVVA